jgi:hypothetical protein
MKKKYLYTIFALCVFLGLILFLIFGVDSSVKSIMVLLFGGLLIGLFIKLIKSFVIPSKWIFDNRFRIEGLLSMVPILLLITFWMNSLSLLTVTVDLIIGSVFGFFFMGFSNKNNYNKLIKKIAFDNLYFDSEVLTDLAYYKENGKFSYGKLILTKQKLVFIPVNPDKLIFEIDLFDKKNSIKIKSFFGIPNGIIINDSFKLSLSYPKLWIKIINAT